MGSYFEGDILHYPVTGANGIISLRYRWPGAVVPYTIASGYSKFQLLVREIFRPFRTGDLDYISIEKGTGGCFSSVGRVGGKQVIGTPIHELMHAVGFFHEQRKESNFRKETSTPFGQSYDFGKTER
ncbi:hypothetical protein B566_EDAN001837 [Ephemera danica]|nr:hypothetical protein B566_EDAN001837 [Ephemera danica]